MDLHHIVERGLKKADALGASEAEVYVAHVKTTSISGGLRGLEKGVSGRYLSVSVRLAIGRKVSSQSALISSPEGVDNVVEAAIKAARASVEDSRWVSLPKKFGKSLITDLVDDAIKYPDLNYFSKLVYEGIQLPKKIDKRVLTTDAKLTLNHVIRAVGNSHQQIQDSEKTLFKYYIEVRAVDNDSSSYYSYYSAPTLKGFNLEEIVYEAVRVVLETINAKSIETGTYEVVLTPRVFSSILLSLITPAIRADNVQMGRSPLAGKLGQEVLSRDLTIVDDGTLPDMPGSTEFDGEGVATKRKVVFDKGVLKTFLYDTYTANIDGIESTGNAVRSGALVYPDTLNLVVSPGSESLDEMVRDLRKGLVVYGVIGEWLSNPVNGYLNMTTTNAVYVEQGDVRYGVRDVVLSGNIYDMLSRGLRSISKECIRVSNTLVPAVMLDKVVVAGN